MVFYKKFTDCTIGIDNSNGQISSKDGGPRFFGPLLMCVIVDPNCSMTDFIIMFGPIIDYDLICIVHIILTFPIEHCHSEPMQKPLFGVD